MSVSVAGGRGIQNSASFSHQVLVLPNRWIGKSDTVNYEDNPGRVTMSQLVEEAGKGKGVLSL